MKSTSQLSHDILNLLERLRIMHDLVREKKFDVVPKEELEKDLKEALTELESNFKRLLQ